MSFLAGTVLRKPILRSVLLGAQVWGRFTNALEGEGKGAPCSRGQSSVASTLAWHIEILDLIPTLRREKEKGLP